MNDTEINECMVAIMGWTRQGGSCGDVWEATNGRRVYIVDYKPATNVRQAEEALAKSCLHNRIGLQQLDKGWCVWRIWIRTNDVQKLVEDEPLLSRAICLAIIEASEDVKDAEWRESDNEQSSDYL